MATAQEKPVEYDMACPYDDYLCVLSEVLDVTHEAHLPQPASVASACSRIVSK